MRTLTQRLVVTAVALVALVSVLIALATTLAMRSYLDDQLDDDVRASLGRAYGAPPPRFDDDRDDSRGRAGDDGPGSLGQAVGTVSATIDGTTGSGILLTEGGDGGYGAAARPRPGRRRRARRRSRSTAAPTTWTCPGSAPTASSPRTAGSPPWPASRPTTPTTSSPRSCAGRRCSPSSASRPPRSPARSSYAASSRRCARSPPPRHRVAEQPLSEGEIDLSDRVPERLTDERNEVGQVGSALNTLLDHVEASLAVAAPQRAAGAPVRRRRQPRAADPARHDRRLHRAGPAPARRARPPRWTRSRARRPG